MSGEIAEEERQALESNIAQLAELKKETSSEAGQKILDLTGQTLGILFKPEPLPETPQEELIYDAAKARFDAGRNITVMGTEGSWGVRASQAAIDSGEVDLNDQVATIQKACNEGLKTQMDERAVEMAIDKRAQVAVVEKLLQISGAIGLVPDSEKTAAVAGAKVEWADTLGKANYWLAAKRVDLDSHPQVKTLKSLIT